MTDVLYYSGRWLYIKSWVILSTFVFVLLEVQGFNNVSTSVFELAFYLCILVLCTLPNQGIIESREKCHS